MIGNATIHTPVLKNPLSGPAYLVSHGGAAFPDVEFVLQGEGITLILDGKTDIKNGITYSRFESAPDAPFTIFETTLPAGPHSVLTPNVPEKEDYSLCKTSLAMPTQITGQNGAVINQTTNITRTGCATTSDPKPQAHQGAAARQSPQSMPQTQEGTQAPSLRKTGKEALRLQDDGTQDHEDSWSGKAAVSDCSYLYLDRCASRKVREVA